MNGCDLFSITLTLHTRTNRKQENLTKRQLKNKNIAYFLLLSIGLQLALSELKVQRK